jgi:hypothetical protein
MGQDFGCDRLGALCLGRARSGLARSTVHDRVAIGAIPHADRLEVATPDRQQKIPTIPTVYVHTHIYVSPPGTNFMVGRI